MQSAQYSEHLRVNGPVCSFCLSENRRTTPVLHLSENLLNLTAFNACSQSAQLCWECKARLKNYSEFCERSERAQEVLNQVKAEESLTGKSLSKLLIAKTILISVDSQVSDTNCNKNSSDNTQFVQALQTVKNETYALKEECDIFVEFDTRTEADDYSEAEYSNNCDEPMLEINVPLKKDDDFVGKHEENVDGKDEPKCFKTNIAEIPNGRKTKKVHPSIKNSSKASFSQNFDIDYNLYEKFTATEDEMREYLKVISLKKYCKICLRQFKTVDNYLKHMKKFHSDCVGEHKCDLCGFGQPTETALKLHRQQHYVLYRCLVEGCRFVHKFPPSLKSHQNTHRKTKKNAGTYECHHCKKEFNNRLYMLKHIGRTHLDATKCCHCGKDFPDRKSLHQHMKLIHADKMFVCDICGFKCLFLKHLRHHLLMHRNLSQKKYACDICNKNFSCRFQERIHQFVHNGKPRITCHLCKTEFLEDEALIKHLQYRHGVSKEEAAENVPSDTKPSKGRGRQRGLATKCNVCGKEFKFPSFLKFHVMTRHSEERPFKCHVCSDGFKSKAILDNHVRKHSDERAFKCDICSKTFKYVGNLYTHKLLHTGEKPYMCNICSTSFAYKGNLKGHMKIHTGEKPFDCNVCGKKFPTNSCLKKHSRIH